MLDRLGISWGQSVLFGGQEVSYSLYPLRSGGASFRINPVLYTARPWNVIRGVIESRVTGLEKEAATACLLQAEELFTAASNASASGAQAMLHYYSAFNTIKALLYCGRLVPVDERIGHGLSVKGYEIALDRPCSVAIYRKQGAANGFELLEILLGNPSGIQSVDVSHLVRQCVIGHRLLCQTLGADEHFVAVRGGRFEIAATSDRLDLIITVAEEDIERLHIEDAEFGSRLGLPGIWQRRAGVASRRGMLLAFSTQSEVFDGTDDEGLGSRIRDLVHTTRWSWHRVVTAQPPTYRRYYVLDAAVSAPRLPQILSAYALLFYFGSMNRYNPRKFRELLTGPFGAFVHEFLHSVPTQLLYLLASEVCQQEIAHPSVVV